MKLAVLWVALLSLSGCAAGTFDNFVAVRLGQPAAVVVLKFGPLGLALELEKENAAELVRLQMKGAR